MLSALIALSRSCILPKMDPDSATLPRLSRRLSIRNSSKTQNARNWTTVTKLVLLPLALFLLSNERLLAQWAATAEPDGQSSQDQAYPNQDSNQDSGYAQPPSDNSAPLPRQPLDAGQLEQLVAPIALYPDPLVAQVLAASTFPAQVQEADGWRQDQSYASPGEIASGADAQPWDPSVKALTAFPQVLAQMDRNLQWTTDLGNAYYNQPQDVMEAVQVMRRRAQAAGSLQSTPQQVVRYDEGNVVLAPADPQVVYVPAYNPWAVYGEPVSPYPGFSLLGALGDFFTTSISYGLGIGISAFTQAPWGWVAWGLDWLAQSVLFGGSNYYSHGAGVADWGFSHYGHHADWGRGGFSRGRQFARIQGGGWNRGGGFNSGGWHGFDRGRDLHSGNRGGSYGRGFQSFRGASYGHGFQSFHGGQRSLATYNSRSGGRMQNRGGEYRYPSNRGGAFNRSEGFRSGSFSRSGSLNRGSAFHRGGERSRASESYRASAGGFSRGGFGRSGGFTRTSGKSHAGGMHLFGGGHSQKGFGGHSSAFHGGGFSRGGGGHAPKFHGGGGFGGGHSHSGGHSGGHGGHGGGHHH